MNTASWIFLIGMLGMTLINLIILKLWENADKELIEALKERGLMR
jgi:hypothetical protein